MTKIVGSLQKEIEQGEASDAAGKAHGEMPTSILQGHAVKLAEAKAVLAQVLLTVDSKSGQVQQLASAASAINKELAATTAKIESALELLS